MKEEGIANEGGMHGSRGKRRGDRWGLGEGTTAEGVMGLGRGDDSRGVEERGRQQRGWGEGTTAEGLRMTAEGLGRGDDSRCSNR